MGTYFFNAWQVIGFINEKIMQE